MRKTLSALLVDDKLRESTHSFRHYLLAMQRTRPTNHIRTVMAGIAGLSMFDTEARTSGKGESSFSVSELKSFSNLELEDWSSEMDILDDMKVVYK